MSHLNDLIRQLATKDPALARDIEKEVKALADRRAFGLNFERHTPEAVDLPGRRPVKGSKVRIQPPRGEIPKKENDRLWEIIAIDPVTNPPVASMNALDGSGDINRASVEDLVVVAEFSDPIYPGLVSTGKVERGGDKPYHSVINAENYHALQALLFTHRGKVDCIYIDPPYNTGAKDWKYNNDYVESDDLYRHSKWLAFMERRLLLAKELLNPDDSVLIVTIDEKEYLRLGLLLEQVFPDARIQMVSSLINPASMPRQSMFGRSDEYLFYVFIGVAAPVRMELSTEWISTRGRTFTGEIRWDLVLQSGPGSMRADSPNGYYPVYIDPVGPKVHSVGDALPLGESREDTGPAGTVALWPIRKSGDDGRWRLGAETLRDRINAGHVRIGGNAERGYTLYYLPPAELKKIEQGVYEVEGRREDGSPITSKARSAPTSVPTTQWRVSSHDATQYGSRLLANVLPGRRFPFPKSLYAVEDAIRFVVAAKPGATVVDFFSGSGTTAHALARINKRDGGSRRSISVTNNEVSADEQKALRQQGLRPGDSEWEKHGICDYITKPRIAAAITGRTPDGDPIKGDYKFTDEFPMADGFEENVEFFTLTYESPLRVEANYAFGRIAPLLWIRAGSRGRRIDALPDGWDVAETYGVISDLDHSEEFARGIAAAPEACVAFIITDEDRLFEALVRELPEHVEPVRLYEAYLRTFEIEARRAAER
ncbi:DNA methyltransferase [Microbacterium lacticum]|uniref:site-specific DNA-methyltransferase n=1 Tax=Microbacterium lacticum TaxID=33885 RepID=UPI00242FE3CC|nr:DNA methyltransferase [Microbacterium lacticum]